MSANGKSKDPGQRSPKKEPGDIAKYAALSSTPTMLIVYPLVGFGLGYLTVHDWNWSIMVPVVTMILGLVQGIREVIKIGKKIDKI
jgi:F0F1-type ATP synthase assembly protein I